MTTSYDRAWEQSGSVYSSGTTRVQAKLAALGLPQAHPNLLESGLLDRFDSRDWKLSIALMSSADPSDWHAISFPEDTPLKGHEDPVCVASDAEAALGYCLELMDTERVFATEARPVSGGTDIYLNDQLVACVRRIRYEPSQPVIRGRVEKTFKGLREFGNNDRLIARAKTLPGFADATYELNAWSRTEPQGCLLLPFPANWVVAMRELMDSLSIPVKQHQAQELVAAFFGAASWHQLVRHQDEDRCWLTPCSVSDDYYDLSRRRFYKTEAESIYAFGLALKTLAQQPPVITSFSAFLSDNGFYIAAYRNDAATSSDDPVLTCDGSTVVEPNDATRYAREAEALWRELAQGAPVPLTTGDWRQDLRHSNRRLGRSEENTLQIGNYHLRKFRSPSTEDARTYLAIEEIVDGKMRFKAHSVAMYKAWVRYTPELNSLVVLADYGHETAATISDVSELDCARLSKFLDGQMAVYENGELGEELYIGRPELLLSTESEGFQ